MEDSAVRRIRTLIVDDEPNARAALRLLLEADPDIDVAGEAKDGFEAVELIRRLEPALVFLDVQMPEMGGFEALAALRSEVMPRVIFVTAYDQYAVRAFEVNALDYLLKPFDDERFHRALDRAKESLLQSETATTRRLADFLDSHERSVGLRRLAIRSSGRVFYVEVPAVDWIEAADQYAQIHIGGKTHLIRESLNALASRLPARMFCRIHRSSIVNVERVKELHPQPSGDCVVVLRSGERLKLARNRKADLERALGT